MSSALLPALLLGAAAPAPVVSLQTALLVVLVVVLLGVARSLADLRRRVDDLEAATSPAPGSSALTAPIPPEVLAVIAAAVHATLGADQQIVSVTPATQTTSWSVEGRRQVFASHKVR